MPVLASDLVKRKKEHVFVEGYVIDAATELTGGVSAGEDVFHVYGQEDPITDITVNNATLSITVYDKKTNNRLMDALNRIDSTTATNIVYDWNNVYPTTVWANRFNVTNTQYSRSIIYKNWIPVPGMTSGDANAKGTRTFAGNSAVPREFNQPIIGEKVKLTTGASGTTWTAQLTKQSLIAVPSATLEPGTSAATVYGLRVLAVQEERSGNVMTKFAAEDLSIDTAMISSGGLVTIDGRAAPTGDLGTLTWATHVYVNYLYSKNNGVYPNVSHDGLFDQKT